MTQALLTGKVILMMKSEYILCTIFCLRMKTGIASYKLCQEYKAENHKYHQGRSSRQLQYYFSCFICSIWYCVECKRTGQRVYK